MRKITCITSFIQEISALIDSGESYSVEEIYKHIEDKDLVDWLEKTYPFGTENGLDLSMYKSSDRDFLHDEYESFWGGYYGQHYRKWGIKNNGLNLLVSWGIDISRNIKDPDTFL
ncbi:hypothetical protein [Peribacillus tepidiphilus]|uniref:hypothetical protein n=1 Tax=Peribacillus tepidiphilus TaxID=2652445 RepID=UPI0012915E5E|nr:hypothetical protein [Peribacillus tepidiphilus]